MKVYTLTMNPAIDMVIKTDVLKEGINRTIYEDYQANGKGINISFILKQMEINSIAMGFLGGFTGNYIEEELQKKKIYTDFIKIDGITRINTFINSNKEYKLLNKGPKIDGRSINKLVEKIKNIEEHSYFFVSGSTPYGVDDEIYIEIAKICKEKNIKLILDISSKRVLDCIKYGVYMIKPNEEEIKIFMNKENTNFMDIIKFSKNLIKDGLKKIIVSLGEEGSIYIDEKNILKITALKGKVLNTACAGDSLLAIFIGGEIKKLKLQESLKLANAMGSLTAFSIGLGNINEAYKEMKKIKIEKIKWEEL